VSGTLLGGAITVTVPRVGTCVHRRGSFRLARPNGFLETWRSWMNCWRDRIRGGQADCASWDRVEQHDS
jgi:hypothetical protein